MPDLASPRPAHVTPAVLRKHIDRLRAVNLEIDEGAALALYLYLPIEHDGLLWRSSLAALLEDANGVTGRTGLGDVVNPQRAGSWLGATGYLALFDQLGKAVRRTGSTPLPTPFEQAVVDFGGASASDASVLYSLRNAFVHSYGLCNVNKVRKELTHVFRVYDGPGAALIGLPETPWDGAFRSRQNHLNQTSVDLRSLGDLANGAVAEAREAYTQGSLELAGRSTDKRVTPIELCWKYVFSHRAPES